MNTSLDDLISEVLQCRAEELELASAPLTEIARGVRRRRLARRAARSVVAVLIVVGVVAPTVVLRQGGRDRDAVGRPTTVGQTQPVQLGGVRVLVPSRWTLEATECGVPMRDTAIVYGRVAVPACYVPEPRNLTVVRLVPLKTWLGRQLSMIASQRVHINGVAVREGRGAVAGTTERDADVIVIDSAEVAVTIASPDRVQAEAIRGSLVVINH